MSSFGVGIDVGVGSDHFGLICLDNSPAVLSAGSASSDSGNGSAMVIGGGLGLPNAI